ncbi:LEUCINE-RICH REPEAT RECEPTOR PROTEIN KINASE EMS1-LIKE-RELATED, partial [Salix purpurea]
MHPLCHDEESHALMQFKQSLAINDSASSDPSAYPKVASWTVDGDCCSWDGVECHRDSGHVIGLDLSSSCLFGSIDSNSSLFHLVHLRRLNLAGNDFNNSEIPSEIRNLSRLFDLNLSHSFFSGQIPEAILELSKLVSIDLRLNSLKLQKPGLQHLVEALINLEVLHLSDVNISAKNHLELLELEQNKLEGHIPKWFMNMSTMTLELISLAGNFLTGFEQSFEVLPWNKLSSLNLNSNKLHGSLPTPPPTFFDYKVSTTNSPEKSQKGNIPRSLANCAKLEILNLEQNKIIDVFPSWLGILPDLRVLILRSNGLHGVIGKPRNNVEFPRVQIVDLSNNSFKGNLPLEYFRNWTAMKNVH